MIESLIEKFWSHSYDLFYIAWPLIIAPSLLICFAVVLSARLVWQFIKTKSKKKNKKRKWKLIGWSFLIMTVSSLSVSCYRVYFYFNPELSASASASNYRRLFNDKQARHMSAARKFGIEPIADRNTVESNLLELGLVRVTSCKNYQVARLTHSIPYLTENAELLLERIGLNFRDSLASKNISSHKIVVTSVLRTDADVKRLVKINGNASKKSTHRYATTFDISYVNFIPTGVSVRCDYNKLRAVLAEVLRDLRKEKACFVLYEKNQPCFHITVRR